MSLVNASCGLSFMYNVGDQVVGSASTLVFFLGLWCQEVAKIDAFDGKINNGRILFHEKGVFGKPLNVQDDERR